MDTILNTAAAKVAHEIDFASCLLDAASLIPTSSDTELLKYLESEIKNEEEMIIARDICSQLSSLWKLEALSTACSRRDTTNDESFDKTSNPRSQKIRESLLNATITLAISIHNSSPSIKQCLLKIKNTNTEQDDCVVKVKEYLNELKDTGCRDISTSVREEKQVTTSLFKLIEKCNILEEEKLRLKSIDEVEQKVNEESFKVKADNETILQALNQVVLTVQLEEAKLEQETMIFLENEEKMHNSVVESLKSELANVRCNLSQLQETNTVDKNRIVKHRNELQQQLSQLMSTNKEDEIVLLNEIKETTSKISQEKEERQKLEQLIALHVLNDSTIEREELLIKTVLDLELEANTILFNAATQMQKLYRGVRDRVLVKSLKKKNKKGKKGKKGKKK